MNLFILAAPKQTYAAVNCNLFYLMHHSLNYHLSFYSVSYGMNETKPFRVSFFFFNSPKLHVEFTGLAIDFFPFFKVSSIYKEKTGQETR